MSHGGGHSNRRADLKSHGLGYYPRSSGAGGWGGGLRTSLERRGSFGNAAVEVDAKLTVQMHPSTSDRQARRRRLVLVRPRHTYPALRACPGTPSAHDRAVRCTHPSQPPRPRTRSTLRRAWSLSARSHIFYTEPQRLIRLSRGPHLRAPVRSASAQNQTTADEVGGASASPCPQSRRSRLLLGADMGVPLMKAPRQLADGAGSRCSTVRPVRRNRGSRCACGA